MIDRYSGSGCDASYCDVMSIYMHLKKNVLFCFTWLFCLVFINYFVIYIYILIIRYEVSNYDYLQFVESTFYRTDSEVYGWSFVFDAAGKVERNVCRWVRARR